MVTVAAGDGDPSLTGFVKHPFTDTGPPRKRHPRTFLPPAVRLLLAEPLSTLRPLSVRAGRWQPGLWGSSLLQTDLCPCCPCKRPSSACFWAWGAASPLLSLLQWECGDSWGPCGTALDTRHIWGPSLKAARYLLAGSQPPPSWPEPRVKRWPRGRPILGSRLFPPGPPGELRAQPPPAGSPGSPRAARAPPCAVD